METISDYGYPLSAMQIEMAISIEQLALVSGLGASFLLLSMVLWSIAQPKKRLWPPLHPSRPKRVLVWLLTVMIFASAFVLGIEGWGQFGWTTSVRWGIGMPLVVLGNLVVWRGVVRLGYEVTSGGIGGLVTDGLYRQSRNPQYVADMGILLGWQVWCASYLSLPVVASGILLLIVTPIAEEPWLRATYAKAYDQYCQRTRRYF